MPYSLDVDLLKSFIAIADSGSFTRAAQEVHRSQSAVSMQMKRLEETIGRSLFVRDGRQSRLTGDGEQLLEYARRIVKLSDEAVTSFTAPELSGHVRMGIPDDYADRLLPEVLARFARTHPLVQVLVECHPSLEVTERVRGGELDIGVVTHCSEITGDEIIRREPLVWVTSARHCVHEDTPVPLALSHTGCAWRTRAIESLDEAGREHRLALVSPNSMAIAASVLAGLAVAAVPRIALKAGMRILTPEEGYPDLGEFDIGILRREGKLPSAAHALIEHLYESLYNLDRTYRADQPAVAAE